jgi:hypothetical protein
MPVYRMPDGKLYNFPDEMPKEEIRQIASKKFPNQIPPRDDLLTTAGKAISTFVPATQYAYEAGRTLLAETALDFLDPRFEEAYAIREGKTPEERKIPVAPSVMKPGAPVEEYLNQPAPISMPAFSPGQYLPEDMKLAIAKNAAMLSVGSQLQAQKALAETPKANVAPGSFDEFAFNLVSAVPDIGIGLAAGVAAVPTRGASIAAVTPYFAAKAGGPKYAEARKLGLSHDQALGAAVVVGAAEGAMEALSSLVFSAKLGGSLLGTVLRTGAVEGITEGATEGVNILVDMGILRQDMTLEEAVSRLQMAAAVGAVGGGTVGGAIRLATGPGVVPDDKAAPTTERVVGSNFGVPTGADPGIAETLGNVAAQPKAIEREKRLALPPPSAPEDIVSPIVARQQTIKLSPTEEQIAQKAADRTRATLGTAREVTTPIGAFSMSEVGPDVAGKVNLWRLRTNRQPDAPVSVADMKNAKVDQSFIDALILARKPLTGEQGLASSTRPAQESAVARTGPFTEEQYGAGVASVRSAGRFTLKGLQDATGATPAAAKLIRDEMVQRGDLVLGTRPGTFKPYERPAAPSTQSPLKTFTVAPVSSDTIAVKKDGKVVGVFEDQVAAKDAVRGIREREKAEQNPPSRVEVVRGGVDAEGKAMDGRPGYAVYENRYDAESNLVDRAIVSTHVAEDAARARADALTSQPAPQPQAAPGVATPSTPRPSVIARSRQQTIPTPKVVEGRLQEIVDNLNEQANRRALPLIGNRVQIVSAITDKEGEGGIEGSYLNQLIELSVENLDPNMSTDEVVEALAGVMDHETVHALREAGVLAPGTRAWSILSNYVEKATHPKTGKTYLETAFDTNPDLRDRPDVVVEEAVAEAFREWAANRRAVTGVPRTALEKIVEWFKRLVGSVPDDIFRSIETGTLARSRIKAPLSYRGAAVEMMEKARADMAVATTPEETLAAQREFLQAREQAAEDRVGRVGPRSVLGTTPSDDFMIGPRGSFDRVEGLLEKAKTDLNLSPTPNRDTPDAGFLMKLANAYDKAKHEPSNIAVGKAYSSLVAETKAIFNTLNVEVVPWRENGQPYLNQRELIDDIADNGQVKMRLSNELFPPHPSRRNHPMQEPSGITTPDGSSLSNGDLLRVVAEVYGYAPVGAVPSQLGDYRAYHTLKGMYSDQGTRALATEMLAQSAWQNAGPKMRLTDGSIAAPDALGYVPPNMREFAEQKAGLLPPEALVEPVQPREDIIDLSGIGDETRYSRGVNKHGLADYLRQPVDTAGMTLPDKPLFTQETNNVNAQGQINRIKPVLDMFPNALKSEREWGRMMAYALASDDVPIAPARLIKDLQDGTAIRNLKKMTPGQIADANHGFENAAKMRAAYTSGAAGIDQTGKLFLWSFLSRGVSPYTQEGLFIDAYDGIEPWLRYAARGEWDASHTERYRYGTPEVREVVANLLYDNDLKAYADAKKDAEKKGKPFNQDLPRKIEWSVNPDGTVNLTYKEWARLAAPAGMGQPGAGASHNLNAFGHDFLAKMSQSAGDGTSRSRLRVIHDMMADPRSTGPAIRRKFMTMGQGVGIDNKVVSFTLLVAGFPDVMVLDRVQVRQLWNDGRFGGINLYDGVKEKGKQVTGTALADITYGARGLLIYEAIEREISERMADIYTQLGRPQDASIGRYHWDTWVTDSGQEASHGTLGAILPVQFGGDPLSAVAAKQGEYGSYAYGARYGVDGRGTSYFNYDTPDGKVFTFSVPGFVEFQQEIKKPANKVVPPKFSVTGEKKNADGTKTKDDFNGPWFTRPEVNTRQLTALAARYALGEAGAEPGTIRADGFDAPIPDGLAARAYPAYADETRYSRGIKYGPAEQSRLPARNRGAGRYALGNLAPLAGSPQVKGAAGPDPRLVTVAEQYARDNGIELRRQAEYVKVDPDRARRIAAAYEAMPHNPSDPKAQEAYRDLIRQTIAQYRALEKAGYKFWFLDINTPEGLDYTSTPWNAMRDLRANQSMGVFPTATGFGSNEAFNPAANPLLLDTGIKWPWGSPNGPAQPVLANDLFRAVHDAFGHGIENSGFRAEGEENAWQAHVRLFTGPAVAALTSETRGQNSWVNYGPYGEQNRSASGSETVFADQKIGLMPEWTWLEGRAGNMGELTAANSYNVGSPEFYAMLDDVVPGGKYYGDPKRSAAAVVSPADTSAPAFSETRDGNAFFGGDIAYHQLQMARDGDRGAVLVYMNPEDFLRLADPAPVREQALYTAAANDGLKFNTMPSLVVESGKVGAVPVMNSDGVGMARALVGKSTAMPVVLYPSGKGQIENADTLTANGNLVDMLGMYEFDIERRGPRQGLSTIAFNSWFKQSAVVDESGAPKRVYDLGTPDSNLGVFDTRASEFRSHFGSVDQANTRGDRGPGYPSYLSIQNPLALVDDGSFKTDAVAKQLLDLGVIDADFYRSVMDNTVNGPVALQDAVMDAGYDGIVYRTEPDGLDAYITFQPTQAKAAVADRGSWSAAGSDIRYSRGRPRARVTPHGGMVHRNIYDRVQGWFSTNLHNFGRSKRAIPIAGSIFDLRINFQDNFLPIKEYYDELVRKGLPIPADLNAYIVEQSVGSAAAFQVQQRERQFVTPLTDAMKAGIKAKRFTYDDVIDFLYALHAPERNAYLRARGSKKPDPSGMTDAVATKIIADAKAKGTFTDLMAISRMADDIVADINQTRLATGQVTADVLAASPFQHWVPLRDTEDTDPNDFITKPPRADGVGRGFTSWGKRPDKRMFGRTSKAGDIVANLVSLQAVTVMRGERARVGKALVDTIRRAQAAGVQGSISILTQYPKRLAYGADGMIREIVDPSFRNDPRFLVFKIDGKDVILQTDDAYISTALRSPMIEQFGKLMQIMMWVRRTYTALITSRNPNFVLTNFVRDAQEALINATQYDVKNMIPKMVAGIPQAAIAISEYQLNQKAPPGSGKMTRHYEEMVQNGWIVSFLAPTDLATTINKLRRDAGALEGGKAVVAKAGQAVDYALAKWDGLNNVAEGTMRLGLYSAMRDAGASITEAGVAAKNLTINFNKGGKYKQLMDTGYLFASVVTNGMAVAGSALKSKAGLGILTGVIGMAVLLDALNRAVSDDEDENGIKDYDQMSEDELARNIILPVHKFGVPGITQPLKIPMAIGVYGAIFNLGRNINRAIDSFTNPRQPIKADGAMGRAVTAMVGAISPIGSSSNPAVVISPWFVDPLVELASNKNWADMDIVPPTYDETKPMSERFYRSTDGTFVWAAQKLNDLTGGNAMRKGSLDWSPEHLQYWFEFATAGTGKFLLDAKYMLTEAPLAVIAGEEVDLGKMPVIKRFVTGTSTKRGAQDIYYDLAGEVKTTENELEDKELRAAGKTRIASNSRVRSAFDRADRQLKDLRKKLRAAMDNKTMTQTARLKKVSDIRDDMAEVMNRAVAAYYDEAEKRAKVN